jgi:hypothetical protein
MLDSATYQVPSTDVKQPAINGQGRPAFRRLSKSQRAALGVAVLNGEAMLRPTLEVVSRALGVSRTYVEMASKLSSEELRQVRQGRRTLSDLKPVAESHTPTMTPDEAVMSWRAWTPEQRAAFGRSVGISEVWDCAIVPTITREAREEIVS